MNLQRASDQWIASTLTRHRITVKRFRPGSVNHHRYAVLIRELEREQYRRRAENE